MRRGVLAVLALLLAGIALTGPAGAQGEPTSTTTTTVGLPSQDIIPEPNTDSAPSEAGDRGGALQLGLLALVLVVVGGFVWRLVRQSRRARGLA